ncbi:TIGR02270 family protein [Corallococcus sp. bb12-1]|uniref:TIGR02270 family protein n=1 Tax=Corallococcus sp. bb12-1 TaxID=2996784 RepID=UPI00226FC15E|nr:TIGR02270 family protein [Corallococcus sp. bb12-1]MCY1046518.1 TIGR02270 family protein [Corallococcus sp. bb12-1]
MEQHLEEAAFLWTQWEHDLGAPALPWADVEQGNERRLVANLDALELGGLPVARRILLPALDGDDVEWIRVATYVLSGLEGSEGREAIVDRLLRANEDESSALLRAVELRGGSHLAPTLLLLLPRLASPQQARLLSALRFLGVDPGTALNAIPLEEHDSVRAEKVRLVGLLPRSEAAPLLLRGLSDGSALVREAALEEALVLGLPEAWDRCNRWVSAREGGRVARLGAAISGGPRELESLVSLLEEPAQRDEGLWALGFSGRLQAAEAIFQELMRNGTPLAAECFAAITGLLPGEPFWEEAEPDDEEADEDAPPVALALAPSALPGPVTDRKKVPRIDEVARWWTEARGRFDPAGRYLRGQPFTGAALATELETGPMRRRPALLLEVAFRTGGAPRVEPRAWTSHQRQQARGIASLRPDIFVRKPSAR